MLVHDILRSCSHGYVAEAAVASIGGDFARQVTMRARERDQSVGDFTANHVRRFSGRATERDWRLVAAKMQGEELALLIGFESVVLRMIAEDMKDGPGIQSAATDRAKSLAAA